MKINGKITHVVNSKLFDFILFYRQRLSYGFWWVLRGGYPHVPLLIMLILWLKKSCIASVKASPGNVVLRLIVRLSYPKKGFQMTT